MPESLRHDQRERVRLDHTLLRSGGAAAVVVDSIGRVTRMNPEAERLTAWSEREALGHHETELLRIRDGKRDGKEGALAEDPVTRALEHGEVVCLGDAVLVARNGVEHNICGSVWPALDDEGGVCNAGIIFHDRTQATRDLHWLAFMHEAGLALSASLDYDATLAKVARLAVDSVADVCAVAVVQRDGSIRGLAGAHANVKQQPIVDELVRNTTLDPLAADGVAKAIREREPVVYLDIHDGYVEPGHRYVLGTREPGYVSALRTLGVRSFMCVPLIARAEVLGSLIWASSYPWQFESSDVERGQQLTHCFALALDNARLYREAREATAAREEFMSMAAHELRTPLAVLQLNVESLQRALRPAGDAVVVAKLARVAIQANRLQALSETMLDVMQYDAGHLPLCFAAWDLQPIVAGAVDAFREEADRARCAIELHTGPSVVVCCDATRISQVVSCLLSNAIKFGATHPIEVTVDMADGMGRITVTDHGIGIAREDAPRIFERFGRAVSSRHYAGLGLGLYLAREIVNAHGGSISASSKPGAGSTFTVLLPAVAAS